VRRADREPSGLLGPARNGHVPELHVPDVYEAFFTVHKETLPAGWNLDSAQMDEFHGWLQDQKIEFQEAEYKKEYEMIRRRLQGDIYETAFNLNESRKYELETDPEVQAAVSALPKSQALLDKATQVRERARK
jgi:hypothetical protein